MKTGLLIVIGILIVASIASVMTLSYYTIHDSSTIVFIDCDSWSGQIGDQCVLLKPEQYCTDWCDYQELSDLGCGGPVLDYIYRHTNLFDEKFDDTFYYRNAMGLPDDVSEKQFEECKDIVHKKRISTDSDEIKIRQISKNKILSKGTGFDLPEDVFTQEDLRKLEQKEQEFKKITDNPDTLEEKRRQIHLEIQEMQDRLQYPFQTGVPYHLVKMLQEKYYIFKEHRSDLKEEVWVTLSGPNNISHVHHALRLGIHPDHFTLSELEYQDEKIREYLGNEMNILYSAEGYAIPISGSTTSLE